MCVRSWEGRKQNTKYKRFKRQPSKRSGPALQGRLSSHEKLPGTLPSTQRWRRRSPASRRSPSPSAARRAPRPPPPRRTPLFPSGEAAPRCLSRRCRDSAGLAPAVAAAGARGAVEGCCRVRCPRYSFSQLLGRRSLPRRGGLAEKDSTGNPVSLQL